MENKHKPMCRSNISCAVYHEDGICPDSGKCDCGAETTPAEEKITITPSPRIDWCGACKAKHGYDCPKDSPSSDSMEERFESRVASGEIFDSEQNEISQDIFTFIKSEKALSEREAREEVLRQIIEKCPIIKDLKVEGDMVWVGIDKNNEAKSYRILPDVVEKLSNLTNTRD